MERPSHRRVVMPQVGGNAPPAHAPNAAADLLDGDHEGQAEQHCPGEAVAELRSHLAVCCNATRVVISCPGNQARAKSAEKARHLRWSRYDAHARLDLLTRSLPHEFLADGLPPKGTVTDGFVYGDSFREYASRKPFGYNLTKELRLCSYQRLRVPLSHVACARLFHALIARLPRAEHGVIPFRFRLFVMAGPPERLKVCRGHRPPKAEGISDRALQLRPYSQRKLR